MIVFLGHLCGLKAAYQFLSKEASPKYLTVSVILSTTTREEKSKNQYISYEMKVNMKV